LAKADQLVSQVVAEPHIVGKCNAAAARSAAGNSCRGATLRATARLEHSSILTLTVAGCDEWIS